MRTMSLLPIKLLFLLIIFISSPALAAPGWLSWFLPVDTGDFMRPYMDDAKTPHASQWDGDHLTPQDWIKARGTQDDVMQGLYAAGIIEDQHLDGDTPVLEVGYNFVRLSDRDKIRVAKFVDHVFGITAANPQGMFLIEYDPPIQGSDIPLGVYTRAGLQLQ